MLPLHRSPSALPSMESMEPRLLLTGGISGTVLNAQTSAPVGGITVNVLQSSNPDSADDQAWNWVASVQTNGSGQYQVSGLDPRHYRLEIDDGATAANGSHFIRADLYDVVVFDNATTTNMNIRAMQAGWITGHVYNDAGAPIAGAQVLVDAQYTEESDSSWHWFETDANGRYDLYLAPTSKKIYPVKILYAPSALLSPDGHTVGYAVEIAPDLYAAPITGSAGPDFHLSLGGTIHGRVITADGAPVADQDVLEPVTPIANGMFEDPNAWTDANGEFWIDGAPVDTDIYLCTADWNWNDFRSDDRMYAWGDRYLGPYNVSAGQVLDIGTLTVPRAGTVRGVVTDAMGVPIVGADVWIKGIDADGGIVSLDDDEGLVTDALGQFRCDWLPPGQYAIGVSKDGWTPYVSSDSFTVMPDQVLQRDIVLQPASAGVRVSGAVTNFAQFAPKNSDGVLLPFSIVEYDGFLSSDNGPGAPQVLAYSAEKQWTPADMIQPDRCFVAAADVTDGYRDYFLPSATPAGRYGMTLPTGAQIVQAIGPKLSGSPGGWWSALLSDPVTVDGKPGQNITLNLTIPKGAATISGKITLPPGYGDGGANPNNALFLLLKPATGDNSFFGRLVGQPDPAGQYVLDDIPAGNYYLYAYGPGLAPWVSGLISVTAGQAIAQDVGMSCGGVVSGTVRAGGAPVAGAAVTSRNSGFSVVTDENGEYRLPGFLVGGDTITISKPGLVSRSVEVVLAADERKTQDVDLTTDPSSISGLVRNDGFLADGIDNDGDGQTDEADEALVGGATVVAYDTASGMQVSTTTVAGRFQFAGLAPSQYVLGVHADGMTTATYPGGADTIVLDPSTDLDLSATPIVLSAVGPSFSVSSSVAGGKLNITFRTDVPLKALPAVTLVSGGGTLGALTQVNTTTYACTYTSAAADTMAQIRIAESAAKPVVAGSPASKTFGFDVAPTLVAETGTTFYNAEGASADMMGAQDNSTIYIPPFALAGGEAASAITLTASRYGDPGAQLGDAKAVTGVYEFKFSKDGAPAEVTLAHQATVTLAFKLPVGMTPAEFEATLKVGFRNESLNPPQWVWNDLADSNPASGISDIRINWASYTITFQASHFTAFAAATEAETLDVTTGGLPVTYYDPDGTKVTVQLRGGLNVPAQALLHFTGIGMSRLNTPTGITVTGSSLKLDSVTLSNTSATLSSLSITTTGGRFVGAAVGSIAGTSLNLLDAAAITLDGEGVSVPAGAIKTLKLGNVENGADISMGAAPAAVSITCGAIGEGSSVSVGGAIASLTAKRWLGGALTADSLTTLTVSGPFNADVLLRGAGGTAATLGTAKIAGGVAGSTWGIDGAVGTIAISGAVADWALGGAADGDAAGLGKITSLTMGEVDNAVLAAGGAVTTLKALDWVGGSISADSIGTFGISGRRATLTAPALPGDLRNVNLSLAADAALPRGASSMTGLGSANIAGSVVNSTWAIDENAGAITVGGAVEGWTLGGDADGDAIGLLKVTSLTLGDVASANVTVQTADVTVLSLLNVPRLVAVGGLLGAVKALRWSAGSIRADSLTSLNIPGRAATTLLAAIPGDFGADITLAGKNVGTLATAGTATIARNLTGGTWLVGGKAGAVSAASVLAGWGANYSGSLAGLTVKGNAAVRVAAKSIGPVNIAGNATDCLVLAGADLGSDARLGGLGAAADTFATGAMGKVTIGGGSIHSVFGAGLDPMDGAIGDNDAVVGVSASTFAGLTVTAAASDDSLFAAGRFTAAAKIAGLTINPARDGRFLAGAAGALETARALVVAAEGGAVQLPDGSSASIPAGALEADCYAFLSRLPAMPANPPGGKVVAVGMPLSLMFAPAPVAAAPAPAPMVMALAAAPMAALGAADDAIHFTMNLGANPPARASGSVPMGEIITTTGAGVYGALPGSVDIANSTAHVDMPVGTVLNEYPTLDGAKIISALGNLNPSMLPAIAPPEQVVWNGSKFVNLANLGALDPNGRTLVLVHGMASSVDNAWGASAAAIKAEGKYDQVVGFNYDWTQPINDSGDQLSAFLERLAIAGVTSVDIEAHSEGGPVSLSGAAMNAVSDHPIEVNNMVLLGSPIMGTPAAAEGLAAATLLMGPLAVMGMAPVAATLAELAQRGFAQDLASGSEVLRQIRDDFAANRPDTEVYVAAGKSPKSGWLSWLLGGDNDTIIPVDSALGRGWGLDKLHVIGDGVFPVSHTQLEAYKPLIDAVAAAVVPHAGIVVSPTSGLTTSESGADAQFSVVLTMKPSENVYISLASSDTGEGTVSKGLLTFTPANWNVPQTITVTGEDDGIVDGSVAYKVQFGLSFSLDDAFDGIQPAEVSLTNSDNDVPADPYTAEITSASISRPEPGTYRVTFSGTASGPVGARVQFRSNLFMTFDWSVTIGGWTQGDDEGTRSDGDPLSTSFTCSFSFYASPGDTYDGASVLVTKYGSLYASDDTGSLQCV